MATKDISDKQVIQAVKYRKDRCDLSTFSNVTNVTVLMEITGQPEKVCYRALERAEKRGLIEVGVSLNTAWLTESGESLL